MSAIAFEQPTSFGENAAFGAPQAGGAKPQLEPDLPDNLTEDERLEAKKARANFVAWIEKARLRELLMLPFDFVGHIPDQYEFALIKLYKKNRDINLIRRMHFWGLAPLLVPFLPLPTRLTWPFLIGRAFTMLFLIAAQFGMLYQSLVFVGYLKILPLLAPVLGLTMFVFYYLYAQDSFRYWRSAYEHLGERYLQSLMTKKIIQKAPARKKSKKRR